MARFSAETVRLAKQELDESLARMQQTAQQLARRGEHAERSARAEQTAAGEKCRQMQQQLDQVRELMVQNQAALYRLEDGLGSAFRRREAALCREKAAQEALEEAQRQYRAAKAMPLPAENDPSYAFLEQGRRYKWGMRHRKWISAGHGLHGLGAQSRRLAVRSGRWNGFWNPLLRVWRHMKHRGRPTCPVWSMPSGAWRSPSSWEHRRGRRSLPMRMP